MPHDVLQMIFEFAGRINHLLISYFTPPLSPTPLRTYPHQPGAVALPHDRDRHWKRLRKVLERALDVRGVRAVIDEHNLVQPAAASDESTEGE